MSQGYTDVFELGDIIRHKRSNKYYLVIDVKTHFNVSLERIEYTVVGEGEGQEIKLFHPLMTINYEKVE